MSENLKFNQPHQGNTDQKLEERLKALEIEDRERVDEVYDNAQKESYTTINFELPEVVGRELSPEHTLVFIVPPEYQSRLIRDVILRHRKDQKYAHNIVNGYDPNGAYSRVEVHVTEGGWQQWADPKGYSPDKFAEQRPASDPEVENLHDWLATVGPIKADALRVTNVGKSANSVSQIHGVEVVFFPELENVEFQEQIYCAGTSFIDLEKDQLLPTYGGGSHTEGVYLGAIALNQRRQALYELGQVSDENIIVKGESLSLPLEPGKSLAQVEISIGDTERLSEVSPKTGRRTRLGYSKLWVGIEKADGSQVNWFIKNANIPPQGVLSGAPHLEESQIEAGDKLIIQARDDTAYLMGWRVAYKK